MGEPEIQDDDLAGGGCDRCGGRGYYVDCIDDMCHGQEECIHGDGYRTCPCQYPAPAPSPRPDKDTPR